MERILDDVRRDALTKLQMSGKDGMLLIDTAVNIAEMSDVTRREGLLALEEFNENNNSDFAKWLVMLVVAATDQDFLCDILITEGTMVLRIDETGQNPIRTEAD